MRILLVEDNPALAENFADILALEGFDVTTSKSAEEAQRVLLAETPATTFDVLLTDLRLPGASGLDALRQLREQNCLVPAILLTAFADEEVQRSAGEFGVLGVLPKPVSIPQLLALVRSAPLRARSRGVTDG